MNEQNFDYLKNQVKYSGFGESLEEDLKNNIQQAPQEFKLYHQTKFGEDQVQANLHFKKSAMTDMYFFNKYELSLTKEGQTEPSTNQTFYIGKDNNITLKEGYNLLDGRSVNKDLVNRDQQKYNAWVQLDFKQTDNQGNFKLKQFHENYGFELNQVLEKHPIKELQNPEERGRLEDSLKKGNRQSVTFLMDGTETKRYIEANPQFKNLNIYDSNQMRTSESQKERQSEVQKKSQKQDLKEETEDSPSEKTVKRKRKRIAV